MVAVRRLRVNSLTDFSYACGGWIKFFTWRFIFTAEKRAGSVEWLFCAIVLVCVRRFFVSAVLSQCPPPQALFVCVFREKVPSFHVPRSHSVMTQCHLIASFHIPVLTAYSLVGRV